MLSFRLRILIHGSVFVDGRERSAILDDMQARIDRKDFSLERAEAIKVRARRCYFRPITCEWFADCYRRCARSPPIGLESYNNELHSSSQRQ